MFFTVFIVSSYAETIIDSDYDGLPDSWEIKYFGNLDNGSDSDFDGDYVSNINEFKLDTNPTNNSETFNIKSFEYDNAGRIRFIN